MTPKKDDLDKIGEVLLEFFKTQRISDSLDAIHKLMAKKSGAEVQTIFIETRSAFLSKGWPTLKKPEFPLVYHVRLGKRFRVTGDVKTFVAELESYYHQEFAAPATVEAPAGLVPGTPRSGP